jgi:hypothetical protein
MTSATDEIAAASSDSSRPKYIISIRLYTAWPTTVLLLQQADSLYHPYIIRADAVLTSQLTG